MTAVNAVGESVRSNELSATPMTAPAAPTLNSAAAGNGSVSLAWSAPSSNGGSAVTSYRVYRGIASNGQVQLTPTVPAVVTATSYTDATAVNGTTYWYKVTAVNAVGESVLSNELSATPMTAPAAPALNSAMAGDGSVALAWSAPSSNGGSAITEYRIYRSTASGVEVLLTNTVPAVITGTTYTDGMMSNGTTYYYRVMALNAVGEGALSNEMSATPLAPGTIPAGPPVLHLAKPGNGGVAPAWSTPPSDGGSAVTSGSSLLWRKAAD